MQLAFEVVGAGIFIFRQWCDIVPLVVESKPVQTDEGRRMAAASSAWDSVNDRKLGWPS